MYPSSSLKISVLDFKLSAEHNKQFCHLHRPTLYVHSPIYAYNYVSFSKPKTFVYKHPRPEKESDTESKFSAVTFSESHEVLNRLSSAFWPGPVTIFAPVKKVKSKASSPLSKTIENVNEESFSSSIKSSCASLTSLTSESSDDQPPNLSFHEDEGEGSVPILPVSALISSNDLIGSHQDDIEHHFVGMRCPSHPLARRILSEVYEEKEVKRKQSPRKGRNRIPGAVMGFSASILNSPNQPYSCKDVCSNLISIPLKENSSTIKPTVHVMNGEDRREMFFVPAGQYKQNSTVSLVIDTPNRTVHIIRDDAEQNKESGGFDVRGDDVIRALHFAPKNQHSTVTSRAITSVLHKWKVNDISK